MTTIRQLILSSPKRANELFAKLVDTSDGAVKTRDRLFSELKDELELYAALEEQHLFPVLKKHKETKDLAAEALKDNRQTRKLLAELESTPKDSEEFGTKVAELRKAFQQHVRDEKKELLPAVKKALSDEEASTVVENIEDEKAQVEAAQQAEADERRAKAAAERAKADERRAKAKRKQEQAEAADAAKDKAKAEAERGRKQAEAKRERERTEAANAAKDEAKRAQKDTAAAKAGASTVAKSDDENEQSEATRRAEAEPAVAAAADIVETGSKMAQQGAKVGRIVRMADAGGVSETSSEETKTPVAAWSMVDLLSQQAQHAIDATMAVGHARTPADVVKAQSDFIGGSFERMGQLNSRYVAFVRSGTSFMSFPSSRR